MSNGSAEALELAKKDMRARRFKAAISILTAAINKDTKNSGLHECLGSAYYLSGQLEESLACFQQVAAIKPMKSSAWVNIGAVMNRLGKYQDATRVLRKAVQRDRRNAQAHYNLGIAQKGLKQLAMAATAYKDAIKINPELAEAHQNLGNVYLDMNNHRQAINSFKKALELRPDFERARKGMAIAENAGDAGKKDANPFGRLVSKEDLAKQRHEESFRDLSDAERHEDRQIIRNHTAAMRSNAEQLADFLRNQLEPTLLQLGRTVAEGNAGKDLTATLERFQSGYEQAMTLHEEVHAETDLLREHDKQIRQ
ncbi:MAG: tetratricopeptide repeat protein [Planctomycetaceae bacterium]